MPVQSDNTQPIGVSIIIPVLNRARYTLKCLQALAANTEYENFELVIVDNASSDETPELLASLGGDIKTIRNEENLGFAKACNQGAAAAGGDLLLFLNNDTEPRPGWLEAMVRVITNDPAVQVVGNKLLYPDGTIQHAGVAFRPDGMPYHIFKNLQADHPAVNTTTRFQAVTAACMLVQREAFLNVGGFDEAYRNGYEDIDFCLKVITSGGSIIYTPHSVVVHHESISPGRKTMDSENSNLFLARWRGVVRHDENEHYRRLGVELTYSSDGTECTAHYPEAPHLDRTFPTDLQMQIP